ncbi:ATP-binding protein [Streptomyces carpaticus]|uniref:ATP-binding protein n=1 Tax=Streptomyces cheonanensis TaxID=312720 RepID=A0ABP5GXX3_9ACTN|nr:MULTISPECIES: ATP-binding protein [unclassified Streptomyces]MCK1812993.1 ATP-binding protein [Streptomyces sp. XM4011]UWM51786.1 ATP-binding protein [Streptomyces carpaticus]
MNEVTSPVGAPVRTFTQLFSSSWRGARLARLLGVVELRAWGAPQDLRERAEIVVAELATNAVQHGRLPGRDFRLGLFFAPSAGCLRVEVTDARGDVYPQVPPVVGDVDELLPCGRGLSLVAALSDHWDAVPYPPSGKTVRAVLSSPGGR